MRSQDDRNAPFSRERSERVGKPSHDDIASRAFEIYTRRGAHDGRDMDDWLQAERELAGSKQRDVVKVTD